MAVEIKMSVTPPVADLTLRGELDLSAAERLGWTVDQALSRGCTLISMDLRSVSFIDCAGLDALIDLRNRLDVLSSHLCVVGRSPQVSRTMRLTGTDEHLGALDPLPQAH